MDRELDVEPFVNSPLNAVSGDLKEPTNFSQKAPVAIPMLWRGTHRRLSRMDVNVSPLIHFVSLLFFTVLTTGPTGIVTTHSQLRDTLGDQREKDSPSTFEIALYVIGAFLFVIVSTGILLCMWRKRRKRGSFKAPRLVSNGQTEQAEIPLSSLQANSRTRILSNTSITSTALFQRQRTRLGSSRLVQLSEVDVPLDKDWEFDRSQLRFMEVLGEGAFGRVVKAEAIGLPSSPNWTTVAVKMLKGK